MNKIAFPVADKRRAHTLLCLFRQAKAHRGQSERIENVLLQIFREAHPGNRLDYHGQDVMAEAVEEIRSRFKFQGILRLRLHQLPGTGISAGPLQQLIHGRRFQLVGKPALHAHQVPYGHDAGSRAHAVPVLYRKIRVGRDIAAHRIIQVQLSLSDQLHGRAACKHLCTGINPVDLIPPHRLCPAGVSPAGHMPEDLPVIPVNHKVAARNAQARQGINISGKLCKIHFGQSPFPVSHRKRYSDCGSKSMVCLYAVPALQKAQTRGLRIPPSAPDSYRNRIHFRSAGTGWWNR